MELPLTLRRSRPEGTELHKPKARKRVGLIGGGPAPSRSQSEALMVSRLMRNVTACAAPTVERLAHPRPVRAPRTTRRSRHPGL